MQTQPIQIPNPATCFELQKAGLLPPKAVTVYAYHLPPDYESICNCVYWEDSVKYNGSNNWSKDGFTFAPTADQLFAVICKCRRNGINYQDAFLGGLFADLLTDEYFFEKCVEHNHSFAKPNTNLAQYLAEVLIFLLSKP